MKAGPTMAFSGAQKTAPVKPGVGPTDAGLDAYTGRYVKISVTVHQKRGDQT